MLSSSVQFSSVTMLARLCSKSFKLGFSSIWTENFQMYGLYLEKAEQPEMTFPTFIASKKKQGSSRKTSNSLTMLKPLTVWITANCGKFLKRKEYPITLPKTCMQVKKQQLELDMGQQAGSKLGKEYVKALYCHPAYLTSMQSTLCEIPSSMKHKLEWRLQGEISMTSGMQLTPSLWQKGNRK